MVQHYSAAAQAVPVASPGATLGTDWEQRVDFARLRAERGAKVSAALERSDLGALILFDMNNIRYVTATHIGNWARDKLSPSAITTPPHQPTRDHSHPIAPRLPQCRPQSRPTLANHTRL